MSRRRPLPRCRSARHGARGIRQEGCGLGCSPRRRYEKETTGWDVKRWASPGGSSCPPAAVECRVCTNSVAVSVLSTWHTSMQTRGGRFGAHMACLAQPGRDSQSRTPSCTLPPHSRSGIQEAPQTQSGRAAASKHSRTWCARPAARRASVPMRAPASAACCCWQAVCAASSAASSTSGGTPPAPPRHAGAPTELSV